jgi:gamma-glutamyltranspeptidase/glutathione hydrolase
MSRRAARALFAGIVGAFGTLGCHSRPDNWPKSWRYARDVPSVVAPSGMVVTTDSIASAVGVDVLRAGGNAVDAGIAVMFALSVVNPEAGNIGGGGFMVVRMRDGTTAALDFREKAPLAATRDMYLDSTGAVAPDRSTVGHLSVGVPGSVMGMWQAHARFGTRPWAELVDPAVKLANRFVVTPRYLDSFDQETADDLAKFPGSAATFLVGGHPPALGTTIHNPDLAATLTRIRDQGADGFYRGPTAALIVAEMKRGGGLITQKDLEQYTAPWRDPIRFDYRGYDVISMSPPSSGGVALAESLNMLETFGLEDLPWHAAGHIHLLAEAWKRAFADRNHYLTDPDFAAMPLDVLTSDAYAHERAAEITDHAAPSLQVQPGVEAFTHTGAPDTSANPPEGMHTTHFSIVDRFGNAVAVTTTLNSLYGSDVTVTGAGFLLNDEMDDFTSRPGTPNQFGLVQGEANAVAPGKRMLSAISPTVVLDPAGKLFMVLGTPGGPTIITSVMQVLSNVVDFGMPLGAAVAAPRVHHQHLPDRIDYEPGGLPAEVVERLKAMGQNPREDNGLSGDIQAIRVRADGRLEAVSDPRRGGKAIGY